MRSWLGPNNLPIGHLLTFMIESSNLVTCTCVTSQGPYSGLMGSQAPLALQEVKSTFAKREVNNQPQVTA